MSEQECITKCKEGDMDAFSVLVESYENKILNHCFRMLGNVTDAEDATQEVFVKVFRFIKSYSEQSSFSTWIYKIASNVCLDQLRKNKRQLKDTVSLHQQNSEGEEFLLAVEDDAPSPYDVARKKEANRVLYQALDNLSADQRQVIVLRDIEGFSYEEIAKITKTAPGTVKSRINRARQNLQQILKDSRELFMDT